MRLCLITCKSLLLNCLAMAENIPINNQVSPPWAKLKEKLEKEIKGEIVLTKNFATFGRASLEPGQEGFKFTSCSSDFNVFLVSKTHFTIEREPCRDDPKNSNPGVLICLSSNGMFVNDFRLEQGSSVILLDGDVIKFNEKCLVYKFRELRKFGNFPSTIRKKYFIGKLLGKGSYGKVRFAQDAKSFEKYAIKSIVVALNQNGVPDETSKHYIDSEIEIMLKLDHPNLMGLYETYEGDDCAYIVMELMDLDFLCYINKLRVRFLPESEMKFFFYQVCKGMDYLHERNIAHRDLKVENIFVKYRGNHVQLRIGDFGFSKLDPDGEFSTALGTERYVAPEVIEMMITKKQMTYTTKADVWSMGCLLYATLFGKYAFDQKYGENMQNKIRSAEYDREVFQTVSENASQLVHSIFTVDQFKRPAVNKILRFIWFDDDKLKARVKDFVNDLELDSSYDQLNSEDDGEYFLLNLNESC